MWTGLILIVFGGWYIFSPQSAFEMRVKWAKFFGMKVTGSKKTLQMYRVIGVVLSIAGFYLLLRY